MDEILSRIDVPLVGIELNGKLYAVLDPTEAGAEHYRPEQYCHTAKWRLLIRRGQEWQNAGFAASQAESSEGWLLQRVQKTIATFDGKVIGGFHFRIWDGTVPKFWGSIPTQKIDRDDQTVARLRQICHDLQNTVKNVQQSTRVVSAFGDDAEYVIEMQDTFDYSDYYVPVPPGVDPYKVAEEYGARAMQRVMGIRHRSNARMHWPAIDQPSPVSSSQPTLIRRLIRFLLTPITKYC